MKNECSIVKDLLPLYVEDLVSDETRAFVEAHLVDCDECRKVLEENRKFPEIVGDAGAIPLKNIKKRLRQQKRKSVFLAVFLVMAILITGFSCLTAPQYVPYSEDLLTITEKEDGSIILSVSAGKVTGFNIRDSVNSDDGDGVVLFVTAWKTTWDLLFSNRELGNIIIPRLDDAPVDAIFYSPNTHEEAIQVFGDEVNYHVTELPRLALVYYLVIAGLAVVAGGGLLLLFRRNSKAKVWIERITLLPVAYILSHILTKGFTTITYAMTRDFSFILIVTVLLYAAGLLGMSLHRNKREMNISRDVQ